MKYQEKTAKVDAVQWFPGVQIAGVFIYPGSVSTHHQRQPQPAIIGADGRLVAISPGDWVLTKSDGTQSICRPDVFEEHYEPVADVFATVSGN